MSTSPDAGSPPQIGETEEMRERRRKQNRLAQQAFRARQKVRVEALESEWAQLRHLHEALNQASSQRQREIEHLHHRVEELLQDIEFLKSSQEIERGWRGGPQPSSPSCASSFSSVSSVSTSSRPKYSSSSYGSNPTYQTQQYPATDQRSGNGNGNGNGNTVSNHALRNYLAKGGYSEFPEFPLSQEFIQGLSR